MRQVTAQDIGNALLRTVEREHPSQQPYIDNVGDTESVLIDGVVNLAALAEELNREAAD